MKMIESHQAMSAVTHESLVSNIATMFHKTSCITCHLNPL